MPYIVDFAQIDEEDASLVGLAGAKLGRMARLGLPIPCGFVISSSFFDEFLAGNNLSTKIKKLLEDTLLLDPYDLLLLARKIEAELERAQVPKGLKGKISKAWKKHLKNAKSPFAIFPSPVDGGRKSFKSIRPYIIFSERELFLALKKCWKSQFEPSYLPLYIEEENNFFLPKIAVVVQKQVFGEISGFIKTFNPESKNTCLIHAVWGLYDESFLEANSGCDIYTVDTANLEIIEKKVGRQDKQLVNVEKKTEELPISISAKSIQKLKDEQIKFLSKLTKNVVKYYFFPQIIKWAIVKNKIFVLDLGSQPIEIIPDVTIEVSPQPREVGISTNILGNIRAKTATKILLQLENDGEFESLNENLGDGIFLSSSNSFDLSNLSWDNFCTRLKLISRKIEPNFLFFYFPDSFTDTESIKNTLCEFNGNFGLIFPAIIWSEKLKGLIKQSGVPVWVSCNDYKDILFLEQYILWGAKGVLVNPENDGFDKSLELEKDDNFQKMLNLIKEIGRKHKIGTGLALGKEALSFDFLREAVFSGLSFVAVPKKSYPWVQEEVRQAEKELVARKHG